MCVCLYSCFKQIKCIKDIKQTERNWIQTRHRLEFLRCKFSFPLLYIRNGAADSCMDVALKISVQRLQLLNIYGSPHAKRSIQTLDSHWFHPPFGCHWPQKQLSTQLSERMIRNIEQQSLKSEDIIFPRVYSFFFTSKWVHDDNTEKLIAELGLVWYI